MKCDDETNPAEGIDLGQVVCEIGVAPVKPAEFVIFRLSQFSGGTSLVEANQLRRSFNHNPGRKPLMPLPPDNSGVGHSFGLEFDGIILPTFKRSPTSPLSRTSSSSSRTPLTASSPSSRCPVGTRPESSRSPGPTPG